MKRDSADLFAQLIYRLKSLRNAAVLMHLLERYADAAETKTTLQTISLHGLGGRFTHAEVRKAIKDLVALDLVSIRVHPNTKTHFTVDREAVLALLDKPLSSDLPGLRRDSFPFLEAWRSRAAGGSLPDAVPSLTSQST